ncbi:MAG TPA: hypothetical protein VM070_08025 [Candidatus Saccharimonadales bacterium]|nr:hypothetical protein [Candidatus Saccharimonadales bacterium]
MIAVILAACGGTTAVPPGAEGGICAKATFVLANPSGLICLDDAAKPIGRLVELPPQSAPSFPSLDPTGKQLVYAITKAPDPKTGFGTDIEAVNIDGTGHRVIVAHEAENVFYDTPRYDATGTFLYFHRNAAVLKDGKYVGNDSTIERLNVRTNERVRLLTDAADPTISADGKTIAFVHLTNGQADGIWSSDGEGGGARPLLKDKFFYLQTPRFSPVGDDLVFCGAGHSATRVIPGGGAARPPGTLPHAAHLGIPSELFSLKRDGTALRSITQTGDDTVPAWSKDGSRIAYISTGAFFVLTVRDGAVRTLASGQDFFFGDIAWLK